MIKPHGGKLVKRFKKEEVYSKKISIDWDIYQEIENIATGVFSPLNGFLNEEDFISVIERGRLKNDIAWTIPIILNVEENFYKSVSKGEKINFIYDNQLVGEIEVSSVYKIDQEKYTKGVFGTVDKSHPGVQRILSLPPYVIGGEIFLYDRIKHKFFEYHLTPDDTRREFYRRGWKKVVAFQTRNVPHIGHEYVQKTALSIVDGLFINPVIGKKKKGDFKDEVIIDAYKALMENYYPQDRVFLSILSMQMRYAGPREAIHHAIIRKNFGATHFIVGRDHAGVGSFYGPFDAHKIFDDYPDLEIEPIFFKAFFKCKKCGSIANDKTCPHSDEFKINFSGTSIRSALQEGKRPSSDVMRPEVADVILRYENPFV